MRIVCIGGGPAGLYFALLMKRQHPEHQVTVVERNRAFDTFGWGVVFSDATMQSMRQWDPETAEAIEVSFNHWDDIELVFKGRKIRTTGHGFVGIGRKKMLNILQERCLELGVELLFERDVQGVLDDYLAGKIGDEALAQRISDLTHTEQLALFDTIERWWCRNGQTDTEPQHDQFFDYQSGAEPKTKTESK